MERLSLAERREIEGLFQDLDYQPTRLQEVSSWKRL
jgi:hypothetical protein